MPLAVMAAITIGSQIAAAKIKSNAANKAAKAQVESGDKAAGLQEVQRQQAMSRLEPFANGSRSMAALLGGAQTPGTQPAPYVGPGAGGVGGQPVSNVPQYAGMQGAPAYMMPRTGMPGPGGFPPPGPPQQGPGIARPQGGPPPPGGLPPGVPQFAPAVAPPPVGPPPGTNYRYQPNGPPPAYAQGPPPPGPQGPPPPGGGMPQLPQPMPQQFAGGPAAMPRYQPPMGVPQQQFGDFMG